MRPLHFGDRRQPLFGMLHPAVAAQRQTAILICAPWGMEYLRAYQGLRLLATALAGHGFATLRFDYRGTGDSSGDGRGLTFADWIADLRLAAAELHNVSGASGLAVFGLRFGALLAQQAVADGLAVDALALWDAPPNGAVYVENLQHLEQASSDARNRFRPARAQLPPPEPDELLAHHWPAELAGTITGLPGLRDDLSVPLHVFVSRDRTPPDGIDSQRLPDAGHWSDIDRMSTPWLPSASFFEVARHLAEVLP